MEEYALNDKNIFPFV